jgi:hypothetical protein
VTYTKSDQVGSRKSQKQRSAADKAEWRLCKEVVWNTRPHKCEECDRPLRTPRRHNFHHTDEARPGMAMRVHDPKLVKLVCYVCHCRLEGKTAKGGEWLDY